MTVHHRLIARHRAENTAGVALPGAAGPTLVCTAALHGNEPAGVPACELVARELRQLVGNDFKGEFIALVGNRRAYERSVRYIHEDLNRHWTPRRFRRAHELAAHHDELAPMLAEDREVVELSAAVRHALDRARGPAVLLDLHTTSADTRPFLAIEDTLASRRLAAALPAVTILGLESMLEGLFAHWFAEAGRIGIVFESGRHDQIESCTERHAAMIWLTLDALRMVDASSPAVAERLARASALLEPLVGDAHRSLHLVHRHAIHEGDRFTMRPGYANFQPVARGEHLADTRHGPVRAVTNGRIFMPLYQAQGDDGFMIVRPVSRTFLITSQIVRRLQLERFARFLPGVKRPRHGADAFRIARTPLRRPTLIALRALGYRRLSRDGETIVAARRATDGE
jgi:succinylglutamate desuccinylase